MLIYFINVAQRTDRRAFMEQQLKRLGLEAIRIEAVTPAELTDAERARMRAVRPPDRPMLDGPLCCSLSHERTLTAMLATGEPWALILEDDVVLSDKLGAFLAAFEQSPPQARAVRIEAAALATLTLLRPAGEFAGVGLHRFAGYNEGSAGYLISRDGARMVLAGEHIRANEMDVAMFYDLSPLSRQLKALQANPALCIQASHIEGNKAPHARSDLQGPRGNKPAGWRRRMQMAIERDILQGGRKVWWRVVRGGQRTRVYLAPQ